MEKAHPRPSSTKSEKNTVFCGFPTPKSRQSTKPATTSTNPAARRNSRSPGDAAALHAAI
ncbi:MAG: hypothetical protein ACLVDB_04720 [Anaeromassilibacillus sp.]